MNLEAMTDKHMNEIESKVKELLALMRKAKFDDTQLMEALRQLELDLGTARRERFDAANPEYRGF